MFVELYMGQYHQHKDKIPNKTYIPLNSFLNSSKTTILKTNPSQRDQN